jgi:hypothetical protein
VALALTDVLARMYACVGLGGGAGGRAMISQYLCEGSQRGEASGGKPAGH